MSSLRYLVLCIFLTSNLVLARDVEKTATAILGTDKVEKFSFHNPMYVIGGDDDLKLQFSFKYRLAKSLNIYFAYTQLMFWDIYDESKPFADVNYNPEVFYRFFDEVDEKLISMDGGMLHSSNGREGLESRSLDRLFLRSSFVTKVERNYVGIQLMLYYIYDKEETNQEIVNHLGYHSLSFYVSDLIVHSSGHLDFEMKAYAGSKVYDFDQGGYHIGLTYNLDTDGFNPSFYFQRFEGYAESLDQYNLRRTEHRIGLMLAF